MSHDQRNGAQALIGQLEAHGVRHIFCVPGESYLAALDALVDSSIEVTVWRNEGGAAMMAEAIGKATGEPGVCFVTRGPGATNASAGVFVAHHDSTPLVLFIGQVERAFLGREAFQEMDYRRFYAGIAKQVFEITDAERIGETVSRAFHLATSGRPGPVVVSLPKDVLTDPVAKPEPRAITVAETAPTREALAEFAALLRSAKRPFFILGGVRWSAGAIAQMQEYIARCQAPIATSYRRAWLFDPLHPCYAGDLGLGANPKLVARIRASDLVILVGGRLGEIPSQGFSLLDMPRPSAPFVHIFPDAAEFGRLYQPTLAIQASPSAFAAALTETPPPASRWRSESEAAHADYLEWSEKEGPQPGDVNLGSIIVWLRGALPADAVICNGAGNYAAWIHRYFRFRSHASHIAPTSATMGYGTPAAIAMKRLHPQRLVVSFAGDGDFLMSGQEFATAAQYNLQIIFIICDNRSYGTIRMHQERDYPGRVIATDLQNPDFAAYARSFGGFGATVRRTEDFENAFKAARSANLPAIIHLEIATEAATPGATLDDLRKRARSAATRQTHGS